VGSAPGPFGAKIRTEMAQWAQVVKQAGIKVE
jgi:hypothetical protein